MEFWGIIIGVFAAWCGVSALLGVGIGRAVHIADVHKADSDFIEGRGAMAAAARRRSTAPVHH